MTAEVAILNKHGVALAADSAVTLGKGQEQKVYNSVNKLFALSKVQPVGVMVFGNSELLGVPWETLIKLFRRELRAAEHETLQAYADAFIGFLDNGNSFLPEGTQEAYVYALSEAVFAEVKSRIERHVERIIQQEGQVELGRVQDIAEEAVTSIAGVIDALDKLSHLDDSFEEELFNRYATAIEAAQEDVLEEVPITADVAELLKRLPARLFCKDSLTSEGRSGVVIAGYGGEEIFPSYVEITIDGFAGDRLRYKVAEIVSVDHASPVVVRSFAQVEMVQTFMEGVHPKYDEVLHGALTRLLDDYAGEILAAVPKYQR